MGGGSGWASCTKYVLEKDGKELFVKASPSRTLDSMFLGEGLGLKALGAAGSLAIPEVYHYADGFDGGSYLIMEYLEIGGRPDPEKFGRAMAEMHLAEPLAKEAKAGKFGFDFDNTIGATPQPNGWMDDWVDFYRERRIGFQVKTAADPRISKEWERCLEATDGLRSLFEGIEVRPSILHGDLWSGNIASVGDRPCIFDPAVYYGHHEAEWGMSWCASLPPAFWKGYRELIPEDEGFRKRADLYELYHKLNHYNLFGGGCKPRGRARSSKTPPPIPTHPHPPPPNSPSAGRGVGGGPPLMIVLLTASLLDSCSLAAADRNDALRLMMSLSDD